MGTMQQPDVEKEPMVREKEWNSITGVFVLGPRLVQPVMVIFTQKKLNVKKCKETIGNLGVKGFSTSFD